MKQVGIIIITYNTPTEVLLLQLDAIAKFCKDDHEVVIIDNSDKREYQEAIAYHINSRPHIRYQKTQSASQNGSDSHAFAANFSISKLHGRYRYYFYLDHDCIPVRPFSIPDILGSNILAGIPQGESTVYFWPGCFMFDLSQITQEIDFSVSHDLKIDTGGGTYKLIQAHRGRCLFFDEQYVQNRDFNGKCDFYASIYNGTFMHFINGSNWNNADNQDQRINSLINIARQKIEGF